MPPSEFPKHSAWDTRNTHVELDPGVQTPGTPPLRQAGMVKTAAIHISTLEQWVLEIDMAIDNLKPGNAYVELELESVMDSIRSHYPG